MSFNLAALLAIALGYLLGAVPFGVLLTRFAGLGDVRMIGSGNIGATNVLRTGNKGLALLTLLLDGGKGAAAFLIAQQIAPDVAPLAGAAAFLGHLYPVYIGFRGGKGVATFAGLLLAMNLLVGFLFVATWLIVLAVFRMSSLSGLVAALLTPLYAWFLADERLVILSGALTIAIIFKHEANIRRMLKGEEPQVGAKR